MKEFKHTPGPWEASFTNCLGGTADYCRIRPLNQEMFGIHSSLEIATMNLMDEAEQQSNARLIAAAPDLLEALQTSYDVFDSTEIGHHMHDCDCSQCAFVTTRDNAVRKAIGEDE